MDKEHFIEKLSGKYPNNFSRYSYDLLPNSFSLLEPLPILCETHGVFRQRLSAHLRGAGCPECYREIRGSFTRTTVEEFSLKSKRKFGNKFSFEHTVYKNKDTKVKITCSRHGVIEILPWRHLKLNTGCQECEYEYRRNISLKSFLEKSKKIHGDRYDYSKVVFKSFNDKVLILCKQHGEFLQHAQSHSKGYGCPTCAIESGRLTTEEFIEKSRSVHGNKYDYSETKYTINSEKVLITCSVHGKFTQRAQAHLKGKGCLKCSTLSRRKTRKEFIEDARKVHGDRYDYSLVRFEHTKNKVAVICKIHGKFLIKPNAHVSSKGSCPRCKESKGETAVSVVLTSLGVDFIREYKVEGYLYRYDFYLPDLKLFIEFHGKQHYAPVGFFGGEEGHKETVFRDRIKKSIADALGFNLLVVNYFDLHEDRLMTKIKKTIDFLIKKKSKI